MDEQQRKRNTKIIIIILAVLLGMSITALTGTLLYNHFTGKQPVSVAVPKNIITPETAEPKPSSVASDTDSTDFEVIGRCLSENETDSGTQSSKTSDDSTDAANTSSTDTDKTATALFLYDRNPGDNTSFEVNNMFPGDKETKYYCVKVSYKGTVMVRFHTDIRPGYEKLAEVLKCRIVLLSTGETIYEGLLRDMPKSVNHTLKTDKKTVSELYYEITAYLDTSVGNEYMEKDLAADFEWWVEETGNLDSPQTDDNSKLSLWLCLASGMLFILILLSKKHRKEDKQYER